MCVSVCECVCVHDGCMIERVCAYMCEYVCVQMHVNEYTFTNVHVSTCTMYMYTGMCMRISVCE